MEINQFQPQETDDESVGRAKKEWQRPEFSHFSTRRTASGTISFSSESLPMYPNDSMTMMPS